MRLLTHYSEDNYLIDTFVHEHDSHGATAVNMFALDCEPDEAKKKYKPLRQIAKTINFLLMYGGSASTLYNTLSKEGAVDENGEPITKEKAQEYYDKYFEAYSGVANFIKEQKKFAHKHGCVYTILGRKRRLHNINGKDFREVAYEERLAVNSAIQGCLEENSAILTAKGYKAIKDLVPNKDELITTYGTTKNFNNYTTGEKQVYKLNTLHNLHTEVYATMEHRFGVYDKGEIIFKKLSELNVNDTIVSKIENKATNISNEFNIHELIGALIGDGNYSSRNAVRLCGGLDKVDYLNKAKNFVEDIIGYELHMKDSKGSKGICKHFTTENSDFRQKLANLGLEKVSKQDKAIPTRYLTAPIEERLSLLRGLFNTDGGWGGEALMFTSKVYNIAYTTHLLLNSVGIVNRFKTQGNVFRVFIQRDNYKKFKDLIGFKVASKEERLNELLDHSSNSIAPKELILDTYNIVHNSKNYANLPKEQKSHVLRFKKGSGSLEACKKYLRLCEEKEAKELLKNLGDLTFSRITSIELVGLRKTMDIEIFTNDHSYIVSNLICHNSGGDIMMMCQPKIDADERLKELNCTMRLQVHDRHICRV